MAELQIRLYSTRVSGSLEELEKSLTNVRDKLDILEVQKETLMTDWEGAAGRQWGRELQIHLNRINEHLNGMLKLTEAVNVIAVMLTETEKNNDLLASQLY